MWDSETIKKDLISIDWDLLHRFLKVFSSQIDFFANSFIRAVEAFLNLKLDATVRTQRLSNVWLHNSLSSLYISMKLLIHGYTLPGNLMRQFGESIALALLCCTERLPYAKQVEEGKTTFAYQKAVNRLLKRNVIHVLRINSVVVETLQKIGKNYDEFSHASYMSAGWAYDFSDGNRPYFGAVFDPKKADLYKEELKIRVSACELVENVAGLIEVNKYGGNVI